MKKLECIDSFIKYKTPDVKAQDPMEQRINSEIEKTNH